MSEETGSPEESPSPKEEAAAAPKGRKEPLLTRERVIAGVILLASFVVSIVLSKHSNSVAEGQDAAESQ